jgi:hypothetical protein
MAEIKKDVADLQRRGYFGDGKLQYSVNLQLK